MNITTVYFVLRQPFDGISLALQLTPRDLMLASQRFDLLVCTM